MQGQGEVIARGAAEFEGRWRLTRRIDDRRTGERARLEGRLTVTREAAGWRVVETGTLMLPGRAPLVAERAYRWQEEAGEIRVFFDDGRPFHRFAAAGRCGDIHLCPPDTYAVTYDFTGWPRWETVWDVSGPRKDYRMTSTFTR